MPYGPVYFNAGTERQERLRELSERASLSQAEILRRMLDHCLQEPVLNQLVPSLSGYLALAAR